MLKYMKYTGCSVKPILSHYASNDRLAVALIDSNSCTYAVITKNLVDAEVFNEYCAFVDTNNLPKIEAFLEEYELAVPTHRWAESGYCRYPEYNFKKLIDKLEKDDQ